MSADLDPVDVAYAGVVGQRELLRSGRLTAAVLLELSLARTARLDPRLGAFRTLLPEQARAEAQAADEALATGDRRPLLGVPVAVKDNVAVAGQAPSHGTASHEPVAEHDDELVRRLRAAGAVVVGLTALPELALWPFTESKAFGATRNPWATTHTPGGSSGGSAAAVAAGLVAAAVASDGGGSIRIPAACCGLVGLKPQPGLVPMGEGEHWHGLSAAGVLTRTVEDTAIVLDVMSGGDLGLQAGLTAETGPLRVAWSTKAPVPTPVDPQVRAALHRALDVLRGLGHEVVQADPDYARVQASFVVRYACGVRDDLAALAQPEVTEGRTRLVAAMGRRVPDALLARARGWGRDAAARLADLPAGADLLVTPVLARPVARAGALRGLRTVALAGRVVPFTPTWNVTGQPAISLPAGSADGLPLAVQIVGRPGSEALLLAVAARYEQATGFSSARPPLD